MPSISVPVAAIGSAIGGIGSAVAGGIGAVAGGIGALGTAAAGMGTGGALLGAGVLGAGASIYSSNVQADAIKQASLEQAAAAGNAQAQQQLMFNQVQQNLSPFMQGGQQALTQLQGLTGTGEGGNPLTAPLTTPFQPTMAQLEQTPGYQFSLDQGLKATQNSYAAQGLGASGAAMKGAANYAQGLASTTYQQQFQNNLSQNKQIADILQNQVNTGANAAAGLSNAGIQSTALSNQAAMSGAAAQAAGTVGSANALAGGVTGATNALGGAATSYALLNTLKNGGMFNPGSSNSSYVNIAGVNMPQAEWAQQYST